METNGTVKPVMAEVKTLTITGPIRNGKPLTAEVKTLFIGGEWMTLRGFQQLQDEDLIDPESGLLTGEPWGRINVDPGDCATSREHLHAVWQKGSELRRACVMSTGEVSFDLSSAELYASRRWLVQAVLEGRVTGISPEFDWCVYGDQDLEMILSSYLGDQSALQYEMRRKEELFPDGAMEGNDVLEGIEKRVKELHASMHATRGHLKDYVILHPDAQGELKRAKRAIAEFQHNWKQSYGAIKATDQLFISV